MITLGIPIVLLAIIAYVNRDNFSYDPVGMILTGIFMFFVFFMFANFLAIPAITEGKMEYEKFPIVSLQDANSSVTGNFFLGCGTIDSKEQYVMMEKVSDNSYRRIYAKCEGVILTESNEELPQYVKGYATYPVNWIAGPHIVNIMGPINRLRTREIIVPKGTVVVNLYRVK